MAIIRQLWTILASITLLTLHQADAQSCQNISPSYPPVMASGYQSRVVLNGLKQPRHMVFDTLGNLLIAEMGSAGIRYVKLTDNGGLNVCVQSNKQLIPDATLNHGIDISKDGKTLYVSSKDSVFSYPYDAAAGTVGTRKTLVTGMTQGGYHQTRTLYVPKKYPDILLVSRGSQDNYDTATTDINSGRSQIRIFNLTELATTSIPYTSGKVLAWGVRNSVGVSENPVTGDIWSVENSSDDLKRNGVDVHNSNPAEEMNYHGDLSGKHPEHGSNYGYPTCVAAWDTSTLGSVPNIKVGAQFIDGTPSGSNTDSMCQTQRTAPRLSFASHTAPLDIKFKSDGSAAYITFHGSWNRQPADGYRLSRVNFSNGQPTAAADSNTAEIPIMTNQNNGNCPSRCFRPTGLAWDTKGRLYMTSDSSGELFVITGA